MTDGDDGNRMSIFYTILGYFPISCFLNSFWEQRETKILTRNIRNLRNDKEAELLILVLIRLINGRDKVQNYIKMQGFLTLQPSIVKHLDDSNALKYLLLDSEDKLITNMTENEKETVWNKLLILLLQQMIKSFPKSSRLYLLQSYILYWKLGSKWKSVYSLLKIPHLKPTFLEEFSCMRVSLQIEKNLKDTDLRNIEATGINISLLVKYQGKLLNWFKLVTRTVDKQLLFWREIMSETPEVQKLYVLGAGLTNNYSKIEEDYKKICEIGVNSRRFHLIYHSFLLDISHDELEAVRIGEKLDNLEKSDQTQKKFQFKLDNDENNTDKICILNVSGNMRNFGIIMNASNEVIQTFGFRPRELINSNINMLMPEFYAARHDQYMIDYFERGTPNVVDKNRLVFGRNKEGYLIKLMLRLKMLPELDQGVQMVGLLSRNIIESEKSTLLKKEFASGLDESDIDFMLVNLTNGDLIGVSTNCFERYGLKSNLFNEKTVKRPNLSLIAPDILKKTNLKNMRISGIQTTINTTELPEKYYFLRNYEGSDEDYHLKKHKKIIKGEKSARVRTGEDNNYLQEEINSYNSQFSGSFFSYDEEQARFEKRFRTAKVHAYISHEETRDENELALIEFYEIESNTTRSVSEELSMNQNVMTVKEVDLEKDDVS